LRDSGIICVGADEIWGINPSVTPAATDKPEKLLGIGSRANDTVIQVGDDIWFFASDGMRGLFRTRQDKVQLGSSYPLSYLLKSRFDVVNWAQITKACAVYFDNKVFLSIATGTSVYNNEVWVFYPSLMIDIGNNIRVPATTHITGWNIAKWAKMKVGGEERLYGIDSNDGKVYRIWYGTSDNGTAIEYKEEGRREDFGNPAQHKVGGEYKIKVEGGAGTVTVSANLDNAGYNQLGSLALALTGVSFPATFPITFTNTNEQTGEWHLDNLEKFIGTKFKIFCNTLNASLKILESKATAFLEEYFPEE